MENFDFNLLVNKFRIHHHKSLCSKQILCGGREFRTLLLVISKRIWVGVWPSYRVGNALLTPTCLDNFLALQKIVPYGIIELYLECILS
jgi:hypothetical protein